MNAAEILAELYGRGCTVRLEAGALILEPQPLDEALCELVRIHANEISGLVKQTHDSVVLEVTPNNAQNTPSETEDLQAGRATRAECADDATTLEGDTSTLEALTQRCWALTSADAPRIERELLPQLSALEPSDVVVEAVLRVIASTTGINRTTLRKAWKQHLRGDREEAHRHTPNHAEMLVRLADDAELFHTPEREAFADLRIGDDSHRETYRIASPDFRDWVCQKFLEQHHKVPNGQALQDALNTLAGKARFQGEEHEVFVRIASLETDGELAIYLDLGRPDWKAVEITRNDWQIIPDPPVRFRRPPSLQALPEPTKGGTFDALRQSLNVRDEDWPLVAGFTLGMLLPNGPYPILQLAGEMGTGKTSAAKRIKSLIDPSKGGLRAEPREISDLIIAASQSWTLAYDNLSRVSTTLSDALCRMSTGGGISKRKLYTDSDEHVLEALRPVILTGINDLGTRSDLLDRMVIVTLMPIAETERRTDEELESAFEEIRPGVIGALLTAASAALRNRHSVKLEKLPRMADFAIWVVAGEQALGLKPGEFIEAYAKNRNESHHLALEAAMLPNVVLEFMEGYRKRSSKWSGSPTSLLKELEQVASTMGERTLAAFDWPRTPIHLSGQLKRYAPNLRALGLEVRSNRSGGARKWVLEWTDTIGTVGTSENTIGGLEEVEVKLERSEIPVQDGQKSQAVRTVLTDPMLEKLRQRALTTSQNVPPADAVDSGPRVAERPTPTVSEGDVRRWLEQHGKQDGEVSQRADVPLGNTYSDDEPADEVVL